MEKKINIAELLKDCPKGMELDCASYDNVSFDKISDDKKATYPIFCYITDKEGNRSSISFTENGCESKRYGAKCVIFPKGKTTWEGFVPPIKFEDGDIVATRSGNWIGITEGGKNNCFIPTYCVIKYDGVFEAYFARKETWRFDRLATEEEKQKLFDAIKANGYKWNAETKTLEKLIEPKFKVEDRVIHKVNKTSPFTITEITDTSYKGGYRYEVLIEQQDNFELVPNKFDISTLEPFDKVLCRHHKDNEWKATFFSHLDEDFHSHCYKFVTVSGSYPYMIPYEGNHHLLGTTNDCDDFYKTWEE